MEVVLEIANIIVILYMMYYLITGIFVFINPKQNNNYNQKTNKLAVIIPARNEEAVIGNLIDSLKKQNYNKSMYYIYVVPNNCTDKTEEISRAKGVEIILPNKQIKSKGDALKYTFEYIKENCNIYDAYIIFDADNVVHPNFLKEMNIAINKGYKIAQGYRDSKNPSDTWISSCYSLHYLIQNCFVNKARMNMSNFSYINGTGFMISKEILEKVPYNTITMTEDIEFTIQKLITNENIAFVEKAITYDEQVTKLGESLKQRKRWSIGTMQCLKRYGIELIKQKHLKSFDGLIFCLAPVIQILGFIAYTMNFISQKLIYSNINYMQIIISIIFAYISSILISILAIVINQKNIKQYAKGILTLPIFMISWIPINIYAIFKRKIKWEPIKHTKIVSIDSLVTRTE